VCFLSNIEAGNVLKGMDNLNVIMKYD